MGSTWLHNLWGEVMPGDFWCTGVLSLKIAG